MVASGDRAAGGELLSMTDEKDGVEGQCGVGRAAHVNHNCVQLAGRQVERFFVLGLAGCCGRMDGSVLKGRCEFVYASEHVSNVEGQVVLLFFGLLLHSGQLDRAHLDDKTQRPHAVLCRSDPGTTEWQVTGQQRTRRAGDEEG